MLLIDFSQLVISAAQRWAAKDKTPIDMDLMRRLTLDSILDMKEKHKAYAEEIVLCMDARHYWRRDVFPHYKGKRKKNRAKQQEAGSFDWATFYKHFDQMKQELRENFSMRCIEVDKAEADDVIATLCLVWAPHRDICIVSSDTDFVQIQQNISPKIKQWSNAVKKYITPANQEYDLFEHVVRGDADDGVPNILSEDDTFMNDEKRQTPIRATSVQSWAHFGLASPDKFCNSLEMLERFERNRKLIDLRCIPQEVVKSIVDVYNNTIPVTGKQFNYMIKNRLHRLMDRGSL